MLHFEIEATSNCNIRCLHCPHELISRPSGRMTWATFTTVVDKIRAHLRGEKFSVSFSGMGEPMLNPQIYAFIKHISNDALTAFSSNGSVLTEANVRKLIESGLDTVYVSFNADQPELFAKMTGGLLFDKILGNVKTALETARGSTLKILANISITKANEDRVASTRTLLEGLGIAPVTTSLCHSRGGFLQDETVCDTPPLQTQNWSCDVLKGTLFIDWEGKVLICAHDLSGDYPLGDLMTEPLETILERRMTLLAGKRGLKICESCNDVMRIGDTFPLESRAGGSLRDWMYWLHEPHADPLSEANEAMKWVLQIYQKKNGTDVLVNRLLAIENATHRTLVSEREELASVIRERDELIRERDELIHARNRLANERDGLMRERHDLTIARDALQADQAQRLRDRGDLVQTIDLLQQNLDARDRQFATLHRDYVAMRQNKIWRFANMLVHDLGRVHRFFRRQSAS